MMAYSGKYKVKNPNKYTGDYTNVIFRSSWEKAAFKWCDDSNLVKQWVSEEVIIPYLWEIDKKYHRYFIDLKITYTNGSTVIVEIKPEKETKIPKRPDRSKRYINEAVTYVRNQNKWDAASKYARDKGWNFQIWTEKTLYDLGILTRPLEKIKPLPAIKKKIKK